MKSLLSLLLTATVALAALPGRNTAEHVVLNKDKLEGQKVTLDVGKLSPLRPGTLNEVQTHAKFFLAHTWDDKNRSYGGWILVAFDPAEADAMVRRFGTEVDIGRALLNRDVETKRLSGTIIKLENGEVLLDVHGKSPQAIKAAKEKLKGELLAALRAIWELGKVR